MKIILFDLDGTLVESTKVITNNMILALEFLKFLGYHLAIITGADIEKIKNQLKDDLYLFNYIFSENGVVSYIINNNNTVLLSSRNIKDVISEENIQKVVNHVLKFTINTKLPYKRGRFISFRNGIIYCTPIGGDCSTEERYSFIEYDKQFKIRKKLITYLKKKLSNLDLEYSLGGNIGVCIHPIGWDKSYCLQFIPSEFKEVYFFGDRCSPEGNDYPLYSNNKIKSFEVIDHLDTIKKIYLNF